MVAANAAPLADDEIYLVDRLTFLVPSRAFHVSGTLLKGGYISLATEFALRLLRDAGALTPGEISAFLGFSDLETRALVERLVLDGYLDVVGTTLDLSTKAIKAFDPISGELKLLNIESFEAKVTLDLIGFAPVDSEGPTRLPWVAELEIPDREKSAAASEAGRQGFRTNFPEWRDRNLRGDGGRRGPVAELVGNEGGVVSGVINLESSGVEAPDRRPRHDEHYHEA